MSLLRSISWRGRAMATTLTQMQRRGPSGCRTAPAWRTIEHALYTRTQSNMFLSYSRTTNPPPRRRAGGSKPFLSDLCPSLEATGELLFLLLAHSVLSTYTPVPVLLFVSRNTLLHKHTRPMYRYWYSPSITPLHQTNPQHTRTFIRLLLIIPVRPPPSMITSVISISTLLRHWLPDLIARRFCPVMHIQPIIVYALLRVV